MARYAIYNNEDVITPSGAEYTAEEWLKRYPWGKRTKMVVGGGVINGSCAFVFDDFVEMMRKQGCDFSDCVTDEDYLRAIEDFEDRPITAAVSDQQRIADALEDLVVLTELKEV